jgi:hypothetical protein
LLGSNPVESVRHVKTLVNGSILICASASACHARIAALARQAFGEHASQLSLVV